MAFQRKLIWMHLWHIWPCAIIWKLHNKFRIYVLLDLFWYNCYPFTGAISHVSLVSTFERRTSSQPWQHRQNPGCWVQDIRFGLGRFWQVGIHSRDRSCWYVWGAGKIQVTTIDFLLMHLRNRVSHNTCNYTTLKQQNKL